MPSILPILFLSVLATSTRLAAQVPLPEEPFPFDAEHPAAGTWAGNLQVAGTSRYANLRLAWSEADGWSGTGIIATFLALGAKAKDITIDSAAVAFTVKGQAASATFAGTVAENGQRITGTATVSGPGGEPVEAPFEFARTVDTMSLPRAMAFSGATEIQGLMKLDMTLAFAPTPDGNWIGHIDVPAQMTRGFILAGVESPDGMTFTAAMPGPVPAYLDLKVDAAHTRLTGTMKQGQFTLDIDFPRDEGYVDATIERPQHPRPPYPYATRNVTIPHPDGHTLAGTLTMPDAATGPPPYAAAVLVTGSGPQDRDETVFGHKPFLVLADWLTRAGIAVVRYDDRGHGASTGDFGSATSADFATDAAAAVAWVRTQDGVDPARVGVIGHSEGGLVAPMVARRDPSLAYIVLLAGPGVPGEDILLLQAEKIARAGGADEAALATNRAQQEAIFALLRSDKDDAELRAALRSMMLAAAARTGADEATAGPAIDRQVDQVMSPWFRMFLAHDPRDDLAAVRCPVLAINGALDLQVWHEQNIPEIARVLEASDADVTTRVYDGLNHLFQPAKTGGIDEYGTIEITMDETVLTDIAAWIRTKTDPR